MVVVGVGGAIARRTFLSSLSPQTLRLPLPSASLSLKPRRRYRPSPPKMASSSSPIIEHVVLFKVKPEADASRMLTSLNALVSLEQVLHLTAGPIHRVRSSPFPFTHLLHSRYASKDDLQAYSAHPSHLAAVKDHVLPSCDDVMAVDWVSSEPGLPPPPPGSALRFTFLKLEDGLAEEAKDEVLEVIKGIKGVVGGDKISQLSCGENFSPARAKGYSLASVAVFPGLGEMEAVDSNEELVESQKQLVRDRLDSVVVVDYVVPPASQPASL